MTKIDCEMQNEPTCPYCGCTEDEYWDVSEGGTDLECGSCGRTYHCTKNVQTDFTSEELPDKPQKEG